MQMTRPRSENAKMKLYCKLCTDGFNHRGVAFHSLSVIFWMVVIRFLFNQCDQLLLGSLSLGNKTVLYYWPLA